MSIDLTKVTVPWDPWILGALVTGKERIEEGWDCSRHKMISGKGWDFFSLHCQVHGVEH